MIYLPDKLIEFNERNAERRLPNIPRSISFYTL